MAPGDLDPNGYIPFWRLLLGRAWLPDAPQRLEADQPATAPAAKTNPRCCAEHCCA